MRVRVLLFGVLKEAAAAFPPELDLPRDACVEDVVECVRARYTGAAKLLDSAAVSVNREYARGAHKLHEGDEVALLPPVSGGSVSGVETDTFPEREVEFPRVVALLKEPIDATRAVAGLKRSPDGALCVFEGVVRDNTRGRPTMFIDYEAYEEMALDQMRLLRRRALAEFAIRDAVVLHRLGRLSIGETSVLIAVASPHRAAAFDACRWLIDTLKRTVPIWKKEHFADGAVWVAGEPFPEELTR